MRAQTSQVLLLALSILLASTTCSSKKGDLIPPTHVRIFNFIGMGIELTFHCKSKDDDLKEQVLRQFMDSWEFTFHPNIWGTTLFFCSFKWKEGDPLVWFDVYYFPRDFLVCGFYCWWEIKTTGPCLVAHGGSKCFPWSAYEHSLSSMTMNNWTQP